MRRSDVQAVYDDEYAAAYDGRFLLPSYTRASTEFELQLLGQELTGDGAWLDLGCGTGYFLSRFPDVRRAGVDISPAMLRVARERNPGVDFYERDFRDAAPDWNRAWTVVSCMWSAHAYVDTIDDVGAVVSNMIEWTAEGGSLFIPLIDLTAMGRPSHSYREATRNFSGETRVHGVIWSWIDGDAGKLHSKLISAHVDQFIEWLEPHFDHIRVAQYPPIENMDPRIAVLATGRRAEANVISPATVTRDDPPPGPGEPNRAKGRKATLNAFTVEDLFVELVSRLTPARIARGVASRVRRLWGLG